eukprot:TRINITY_DN2741_c0_g1_i1.p1 TRINITY_DN2741_c0_g1~~TRINITY_DN2741_c0_g1_i1.p1  ORF type:complete len:655 (-),score=149.35 TRINITY_DN2741_c0_g1_i1:10-1974(-)
MSCKPDEDDTSSPQTTEDDVSSHESLVEDQIGQVVQGLLEEIPIRFFVIRWVDMEDPRGFYIVAYNQPDDLFTSLPVDQLINKRLDIVFPYLREKPEVWEGYRTIIRTGVTITVEGDYKNEKISSRFRVTHTPLPANSVMVVYEDLNRYRDLEAKRKENSEQMEVLLEKAVDLMVRSKPGEGENVNILALKQLFTFSETNSGSKVLVEQFEKRQKVISMADVQTLVQNLSCSQDHVYIRQFLMSFRYFMTPAALLKKLIVKFMTALADGNKDVKDNVINCLRVWTSDHFYDFDRDPELMKKLQEFINNALVNSERADVGESLNKIIAKQIQNEMQQAEARSAISPESSPNTQRKMQFNMLQESPTEIAQQLTLLCLQRFKAVKPVEFFQQAWSKKDAKVLAPNILGMINAFNKITNWVCAEVLLQKVLKDRILTVKHFIDVAWAAYGYRDFETTFAVIIGLGQQPVSRLSETWKGLDHSTKQRYLKLYDFTLFTRNYKNYRKMLRGIMSSELGGNVIPHFSLYLKDLTILEEKTGVTKTAGCVNFQQMRTLANTINEIKKAQSSIFAFPKDVKIVLYLTTQLPNIDDDAQWFHSKRCEAESTGEDPAVLCAQSASITSNLLRNIQKNGSSAGSEVLVHSNPIFGLKLKKVLRAK